MNNLTLKSAINNIINFYIDDATGFDSEYITKFLTKIESKGLSRNTLDLVSGMNILQFNRSKKISEYYEMMLNLTKFVIYNEN